MSSTGAMFMAAGTMLSCRTPRMISTSSTSLQKWQQQQQQHQATAGSQSVALHANIQPFALHNSTLTSAVVLYFIYIRQPCKATLESK
jgi:hypothetical protein